MKEHEWNIKEVCPNIYQIEDYKGVHCTLVKGQCKAVLWDVGYGFYNLKGLIQTLTNKEVLVFASHGHLDHTLGCTEFSAIYLNKKDQELFKNNNSKKIKKIITEQLVKKGYLTKHQAKEYTKRKLPQLKDLNVGDIFDLGGITAEIINLHGHTKGSVGLLLKELEILLTGDAICNDLWIYLPESENSNNCLKTLNYALNLPFKEYLVAHKDVLYPKEHIKDIIEVMQNLNPKVSRPRSTFFAEDVYENHKQTEYGTISILFTEEKIK